ncbi:MAG TPA: alkaline phosphatase family protein [Puia sp.]|jgi:YVTN family beta-propeller protein|nr:alkaline phosphatase family protein [Puia sp.]
MKFSSLFSLAGLSLLSGLSVTAQLSQRDHIPYDDSTLTSGQGPYAMPYNRWIDPAGVTVRFGDPKLENHSLDAVLLPGGELLAVEDRYGIILFKANGRQVMARYSFTGDRKYGQLMSTYSGIKAIKYKGAIHLFWGAGHNPDSYIMEAIWNGHDLDIVRAIPFPAMAPAPMTLPNEILVREEDGDLYLYVVLNGSNQLTKIRLKDQAVSWTSPTGVAPYGLTMAAGKIFVTNWAGPVPTYMEGKETAGVPYGSAYTDPRTGATARGTVTVIDPGSGKFMGDIEVGLHPNAIIHSPDEQTVFVANGNSDYVSVIRTATLEVTDTIPVSPFEKSDHYAGSTPCALAIDPAASRLYVANGLNNAVAVIGLKLHRPAVLGFIPTEAWPSGIVVDKNTLYVTSLEAIGARSKQDNAYNSHWQQASASWIPIPDEKELRSYTARVRQQNLSFREALSRQMPRPGVAPQPVPERIGEPSLFRHVVYIIKENRTYDQVLGDLAEGRGEPSFCVFGDSVTPNQHRLARDFQLLDNYYASGKSSAEGHQWTDAAMVTDYVERMVRAWFRSYPHAQYDAMVYDKEGFIWNNALDHGKTVRIYGEACTTTVDKSLDWTQIYHLHETGQPFDAKNVSTISRVRPILSASYPGYDDSRITDQLRADAFIKELKGYEDRPGDEWPQLMVLSLPNDHTTGLSPGYPTPRAMVADNDLALGRIVEAISHSRFWDSTAIFVTEDDSQAGWDHISAYRTTGFVISPFSRLQRTVSTNYNQTSLVRTIEQILGIPPMNAMDGTALPMFDCFTEKRDTTTYTVIPNRIPLNEMNHSLAELKGRSRRYARMSLENREDEIDEGDDDVFNRILWWATRGSRPYPRIPMSVPEGQK